jgi:predicted nucleic acid-binding protein
VSVLVDTSVWVEYLRATESRHDHQVLRLVDEEPTALAWTEPVLHELASGARSAEHATQLGELLGRGPVLPLDGLVDWGDAATLSRRARRNGTPVRSALDCLIATVAIRTDTPVLARDRDFIHLAAVSDLELLEP